jgi:Cysteine-rich CPCC
MGEWTAMTGRNPSAGNPSAGDPWETVGDRFVLFARLHADGVLPEVPCQACGYPTLPLTGRNHICVVCHWRDDGSSRDLPDVRSMENQGLTLRQAAAHIAETGVFASQWHALVAPEYFVPDVKAARAELMRAYDRLGLEPLSAAVRADVQSRRTTFMYTIVHLMR